MHESKLKKKTNLKSLKCKQYRQLTFPKNSTIIRKNESFRHVYLLKSGQAAICSDDHSQPLQTYQKGDYLNVIEIAIEVNSYKTIKAITKCEVLLMILGKGQLQEQKRKKLIPKMQQLKFYEIMIFKTLPYGMILELATHFTKQTLCKFQVNDFLKQKHECTCFIVSGSLVLESLKKKPYQGLRSVQTCHSHKSRKFLQNNNLRLLKFQAGQMLFANTQSKYQYICEAEKCQIIYIATELLYYYLPQEFTQKVKQLKASQTVNVSQRRSSTFKALKSMSKSINRSNTKSYCIPQRFLNQVQQKCQKFEKVRSVHYSRTNRDFRSYSDQKNKIMQARDQGYKEISQLNRRKYGRNYICEKRLEISRNIHGDTSINQDQTLKPCESDSIFFRRGLTVYETITLKDDYGIIKHSPAIKFVQRNRSKKSQGPKSEQTSPIKMAHNEKEVQALTLNSVHKVRMGFEQNSNTLLKNYKKKQMTVQS